jgi:hypothetical protein
MDKWRPDDWPKDPCIDCPNKQVDDYGYLCDLACGKRAAWMNQEIGADRMLSKARIRFEEFWEYWIDDQCPIDQIFSNKEQK